MDAAAIARPYAAATFAYAQENKAVSAWQQSLSAMAQSLSAVEEVVAGGALVTSEQAADIAIAAADAAGGADPAQQRFLQLLAENDRVFSLPAIFARFEHLRMEAEGVVAVHVESAMPMENTGDFDKHLKQRLGKEVQSSYAENPELLGGVRVYVADDVIDASIRGRLERLAETLAAGAVKTHPRN